MKRKFRIKTALTILLVVVFTIAVIGAYIWLKPVSIKYGISKMYTKEDMDAAIEVIIDDFYLYRGRRLFSLSYSGDERSIKELDYCNSFEKYDEKFAECIVFDSFSIFYKLPGGEGSYENTINFWSWILARTENGPWQLISCGYA